MIATAGRALRRVVLRFERLLPFERRWAETIFDALLAIEGEHGLPGFPTVDATAFWRALGEAPSPSFRLGLRAFVWALTFLPLFDARARRPFFALPRATRLALVAEGIHGRSYLTRQMFAALKMLACFAYFDDSNVRAAVTGVA